MVKIKYNQSLRKIAFSAALSVLAVPGVVYAESASPSEVSQLKNQVEALLKRIDTLEKKQAEVGFENAGQDARPKASVDRREKNPLSLQISGHVNRGVWVASNGANTSVAHVDNDNSPSRLIITGTGEFNPDTTIGATLAFGVETNSTDQIDVRDVNDGSAGPTIRQAELFVKSKRFGELYVGQGSTASDGTMEDPDLSGTSLLSAGGSMSFIAGGALFTSKAAGNAKLFVDKQPAKADSVFDAGDGLTRRNRIRYKFQSKKCKS